MEERRRLPRFIVIAIYLFLWERARRSVTQNREIQDIGMRGTILFSPMQLAIPSTPLSSLSSLFSLRADLRFSCPRGGVGWKKGRENFQKGLGGEGPPTTAAMRGRRKERGEKRTSFSPSQLQCSCCLTSPPPPPLLLASRGKKGF